MSGLFGTTAKRLLATVGEALGRSLGMVLARQVVGPERVRHVSVRSRTVNEVTLTANVRTRQPGVYGLWVDAGARHELIGEILHQSAKTVTRRILRPSDTLIPLTATALWTGHVFPGPEVLDPAYTDVAIPVPGGHAAAWRLTPPVQAQAPGSTWAIHIHGIRTSRVTALRTVPAAHALGYISLVPSFRGDGAAPATPNGYSSLGQREWEDIDAALDYAVANGATSIVLFGWSMGATIALLLSERSHHRHLIAGIVLIGPPTNWRTVISYGATQAKLPGAFGRFASYVLSHPTLSVRAGLPEPLDLDALDWTSRRRLTCPTLVIHSSADRKVPVSLTHRFAEVHPELVEVVDIPDAEHAWEFNVSQHDFTAAITDWSARRVAASIIQTSDATG